MCNKKQTLFLKHNTCYLFLQCSANTPSYYFYCPHPKDGDGNVFTGVCLLIGGVPPSQDRVLLPRLDTLRASCAGGLSF